MVVIVRHYCCEECEEAFDTMEEAKEHEKKCKIFCINCGYHIGKETIWKLNRQYFCSQKCVNESNK